MKVQYEYLATCAASLEIVLTVPQERLIRPISLNVPLARRILSRRFLHTDRQELNSSQDRAAYYHLHDLNVPTLPLNRFGNGYCPLAHCAIRLMTPDTF